MNIVFWNNSSRGTGASTSNLICIATAIAHEKKFRTILAQTQFDYSDLESGIMSDSPQELKETALYFEEIGVDALIHKMKFKPYVEAYKDCFIKINSYIKFLPPTARTSLKIYEDDIINYMDQILSICDQISDLIYIDIPSGKSKLNLKLLQSADVIVVNLSQNTKFINEYLMDNPHLYKKAVFIIGNYSSYSKNSLTNICKKLNLKKQELGVIPFNIDFMDALNRGNAVNFVTKFLNCSKKDENYEFIENVRRSSRLLLKKIRDELE